MMIKASFSKTAVRKLLCVLIFFVLYLISLVILTVLSYYSDFDYELVRAVSYSLLSVFVFASSFVVSRNSEKTGWLNGIIASAVFLALTLVLSLLVNGSECDIMSFLIKSPLFITGGAISGIIGINCKK